MRPQSTIRLYLCDQCDTPIVTSRRGRYCGKRCSRIAALTQRRRALLNSISLEVLPSGAVRLPLFQQNGAIVAYTLIDEHDVTLVGAELWGLDHAGYAYRRVGSESRIRLLLHRVLLGLPTPTDGRDGDHINRDRLDNRRANLRIIPSNASPQNRGNFRGSRSQYRGVDWFPKTRKWRARIRMDGGLLHLGYFEQEEDAAIAAQAAREWLLPYAVD